MSTQQTGDREPSERTIKFVADCFTAIESERPGSDASQTIERAELVKRLESGLRCIEYSEIATESISPARSTPCDIPAISKPAPPQLGEYLLVREIGRGGMGVVYEAVQPALARRVALKILPYSRTLDPRQLLRFKNESLAAAQLDHPNIVRVISVGQDGDMHYYAMQYVEGESLATVLTRLRGSEPRRDDSTELVGISERSAVPSCASQQNDSATSPTIGPDFFHRVARWGVQAADGLEHAHAVGVIHRDIKPSNLLLDSTGKILITDFGVALIQNAPELTVTGDLLGTARYMSPEQWQGKPGLVDHRADLYSLGATLYELLTLRPVLVGDDRDQLRRQIVDEAPPAPRSLVRAIPRDLETIVLKALSKEPDDRYSSAQEMADDLRRFLNDRPIRARRPTLLQRLFRWTWRHRTLAASGVLMLAIVAVGLAISTSIMSIQRNQINLALAKNRELLEDARRAERRAAQANRELREHLYSVKIRLAYRAWHTAEVGHAVELLEAMIPAENQIDYRGVEWHLLWQRLHAHRHELNGHRDEVYSLAYSGDGRWLATSGKDARICLWKAETGELTHTIETDGGEVNAIAFRGDGEQLAAASDDGKVRLFDVASGKLQQALSGHAQGIFCVAYVPGTDTLISAGRGGTVRLWDARRYNAVDHFTAHADHIEGMDISPDGSLLATASRDDTIGVWDLNSRTLLRRLKGHSDTVLAVAFSPDATRLASGGEDDSVLLWDVASGELLRRLQGHQDWVQSVSFAGEGDAIVSSSKDSTVRLWQADTGMSLEVLRGHRGRIWNVKVSPDGQTVATAGADRAVKVWSWPAVQRHSSLAASNHPFTSVAVSPDGRQMAEADGEGRLSIFETATGRLTSQFQADRQACQHVLFTGDGSSLITAGSDNTVRVWQLSSGELRSELCRCAHPIQVLKLDPMSTNVACLSGDGIHPSVLHLGSWERSGDGLAEVETPIGAASRMEFTRDDGWLVVGKPNGEVLALEPSGRIAFQWQGHDCRVGEMCFNAAGTLLATSGHDGLIKIWSWPKGDLRHMLHGHSDAVRAMAFSGDGRTLASGGDDGVVRLWSVATGQELTILARFDHRIEELASLPQDRGLLVATNSSGDDALVGWFTDATAWPHRLFGGNEGSP